MKSNPEYVWLVAYIDGAFVDKIEQDIKKYPEYILHIEAHVPMVKVLKKKFKGQDYFDHIPLLFNYGFIKVPLMWAINIDILTQIKDRITCISHWVVDPARNPKKKKQILEDVKSIVARKKARQWGTFEQIRNLIPCAIIHDHEVEHLLKVAKDESIHSSEDINKIQKGDLITLMGYPFDGMLALVKEVDKKRKQVVVSIGMLDTEREIRVSFDNAIYSIYRGSYDEAYSRDKTTAEYKTKNYTGHENE